MKLLFHFYKHHAIKIRQLDFSLNIVYQNSQLDSSGLLFWIVQDYYFMWYLFGGYVV